MPSKLQSILVGIIQFVLGFWGQTLGTAIATGGVAVLAWLNHQPMWVVVMAALGTIGIVLWVKNQWDSNLGRHRLPLSSYTNNDIHAKLSQWAYDFGYGARKEQQITALFQILVEPMIISTNSEQRKSVPVIVTRPQTHPELLDFWCKLVVQEKDYAAFDGMPLDIRWETIENIRLDLAKLGAGYKGVGLPLREVEIHHDIPLDAIRDRFHFREEIWFIVRCQLIVLEHVNSGVRWAQSRASDKKDSPSGVA